MQEDAVFERFGLFYPYLAQLDVVDMYVDGDLLDSAFQSDENLKSVQVGYPELLVNGNLITGYNEPVIQQLNPQAQDNIIDLYCQLWAREMDGHSNIPTLTIENPYH